MSETFAEIKKKRQKEMEEGNKRIPLGIKIIEGILFIISIPGFVISLVVLLLKIWEGNVPFSIFRIVSSLCVCLLLLFVSIGLGRAMKWAWYVVVFLLLSGIFVSVVDMPSGIVEATVRVIVNIAIIVYFMRSDIRKLFQIESVRMLKEK